MKIYEKEQLLKKIGFKEGLEKGIEKASEQAKEQTKESAKRFFENGVSYELVRASIVTLSDEELQEIYENVKK